MSTVIGLLVLLGVGLFFVEQFTKDDKTKKGRVTEFIEDLKER